MLIQCHMGIITAVWASGVQTALEQSFGLVHPAKKQEGMRENNLGQKILTGIYLTDWTTESLFIYWMKCHNKEQFLISNRLHTIPIQIKEYLKMCHHFCRNIKQRNHFQHVLKHNLYHESLHWFIFQCGLRSNFLIWPFWFCLGVDRYVFFRADTDTDYYRSSRPITDILNRYTCLV